MSADSVELIIHYLCPYAQRALYSLAFKNIEATITEVDLSEKAEWFLAVNPQGRTPSARVTRADGRIINLFESLTIAHYFDTFPGKSMFPAGPDGKVTTLTRAVCDAQTQYISSKFVGLHSFYISEVTEAQVQGAKAAIREINAQLGSGFFMDSILGTSEYTFTDIMVLPLIERLVASKDTHLAALWGGEDFSNILRWHDQLFAESWAQRFKANTHYLSTAFNISKRGKYHEYKLPLSRYESVEAYES
mmetsp:Transcript_11213/g.22060  ORF Transcript_11213/g.22060 Transcript_11213/m.22060 type:complete len:248 (+) Transcript_11213:38-781(+)